MRHGPLICPADRVMFESYFRMERRGFSTTVSIVPAVVIMPGSLCSTALNYKSSFLTLILISYPGKIIRTGREELWKEKEE